jgi:predicted amidohydrolase
MARARSAPFTVGIIQETAGSDIAANVERQIARVREARDNGAQVVCLQ